MGAVDVFSLVVNQNSKTLSIIAIVIVTALLFLTRYLGLGDESLWLDETFSATHSLQSPHLLLADHFVKSGANPPLYDIILHYWIQFWGTSEIAMRSLSATFSILTVFPILSIGASLFRRKIGAQTVVLYTVCSLLIYFSHEVRAYQLFLLLSSSAIALFLKIFTKRSITTTVSAILLSWLTLFTHPYGWFFVMFIGLWWIYKIIFFAKKSDSYYKQLIIYLILFSIPIAMYGFSFLSVVHEQAEHFGGKQPTILHLAGAIHLQLTSFFVGGIAVVLLGKLAFKSKSYFSDNRLYVENVLFLILWYSSFTLLPFIISLVRTPIFRGRYTLFSIIPLLFLLVIAIDSFSGKRIRVLFFSSLVFFFSLESFLDSQAVQMEPWKEITQLIDCEIPLLIAADYIAEYPLVYYPLTEVTETEVVKIEELYIDSWQERVSNFILPQDEVTFLSSHFEAGDSILVDYFQTHNYRVTSENIFTYRDLNNMDRHAATVRTFSKITHEENSTQMDEEL